MNRPFLTLVALSLPLLVSGAARAQQFTLPVTVGNPGATSYPFAGPAMRYQQWWSPSEWRASVGQSVRVTNVQFKAATSGMGVANRQIELEVAMGNSSTVSPTSHFESNFTSGKVTVFPRAFRILPAPTPGTWPISLNFTNEFLWDGVSGVVLEIKLWNNGNNNQPWIYELEYDQAASFSMYRLWDVTGPTSQNANFLRQGQGLIARFTYATALSLPYGTGCAGEGGHVPLATTEGGLPVPGNGAWRHALTNAPSQRPALFFMGFSPSTWGTIPLPFDLGAIGATGCSMYAEYVAGVTVQTVGGGPGSGAVRVPFGLPATTNWVGVRVYSQWLVLDPNAANGMLAASNAIWTQTGFN